MSDSQRRDRVIIAHTAGTPAEAMVIRGLLESAGIRSPSSTFSDPFPLHDVPEGTHGVEIYVLESQADAARRLIADYLQANASDADSGDFSGE